VSLDDDRRRRRGLFAALLVIAAFTAAASGCSTGRSAPRPSASATPAGDSVSGIPTGPSTPGIPTGTQLQQLMPYHVDEPAGWHLLTNIGDVRNSGSKLIQPIGLVPNSNDCVYVDEMVGPLEAVPWWPVSWAFTTMDSPPSGGNIGLHVVYLLMAGFRAGYATKQLDWAIARAAVCPTYIDTLSHLRVDLKFTVIHGLGDGAVYIHDADGVGTPVVAITETIIARVGNDLVVVQQGSGDALVPLAELKSFCRLLIQRIAAFR
jgi:hypothetical protein